jgi:GT2 family glycosyltransferase
MSNLPSNYYFVIATQYSYDEFWEKSQIAIFLEKAGLSNNCSILFENKDGLPHVYNKFINESYANKRVIFVHDDVLIEDLFWEEKLNLAFDKYDIVGLAGAKKCDLSSNAPAWHLMAKPEDYLGEVAHGHQGKTWTTIFGPTNGRTLTLDGLFIAVNINNLITTGVRFDENFQFHHYDITFCLRANQNKLKMGITPIKVTHFGLGDSMNTPEWHQSAEKFKQLYK